MKRRAVVLTLCGLLLALLGLIAPSLPGLFGAQYRETAVFLPLVLTVIRPFVLATGLLIAAIGGIVLARNR